MAPVSYVVKSDGVMARVVSMTTRFAGIFLSACADGVFRRDAGVGMKNGSGTLVVTCPSLKSRTSSSG